MQWAWCFENHPERELVVITKVCQRQERCPQEVVIMVVLGKKEWVPTGGHVGEKHSVGTAAH